MERDIALNQVEVCDPFWREIQERISRVVLPYQWEALNDRAEGAEPSRCMANFRAAAQGAGERWGTVFLDSDAYKWLEAAAYSLTWFPDPRLEAAAEEAVETIIGAQQPDGYLNTYYTLCKPEARFRNLTEGHELYCAGHLFEAAAAYAQATGKTALLDAAMRFARCLKKHFLDGGADRAYPGHPEVELGLVKLYKATGDKDCLRLCEYFLDSRGQGESLRDRELRAGGFRKHWGDLVFGMPLTYFQAHAPVREQRKATGHAVRAMYLYSAMADAALITGDRELEQACRALYEDTVRRQMYVTGGIGAAAYGEQFTSDYDLPNDSVYAETCASVGLMMFSQRMWKLTRDPACFDVWEKVLCNNVLASMGRDGRSFFYVNPLETDPKVIRENPSLRHVLPERAKWFGVACCPPNMARCVLSLGASLYARGEDELHLLSHIDSRLTLADLKAELHHEGESYCLTVEGPPMDLRLRVPEGSLLTPLCGGETRDGYLHLRHPGGREEYPYLLAPQARILYAHPQVAHDAGKACVAYGPMVYCLEEADNGPHLCELALADGAALEKVPGEGMTVLKARGLRYTREGRADLYSPHPPKAEPAELTFIPYYQWGNRGAGEMRVFVLRAP